MTSGRRACPCPRGPWELLSHTQSMGCAGMLVAGGTPDTRSPVCLGKPVPSQGSHAPCPGDTPIFSFQTICLQPTLQTPTTCTPSPPSWTASQWRICPLPSQTKPCPTEFVCQAGCPRLSPQDGVEGHHFCCRGLSSEAVLVPRKQPQVATGQTTHSPFVKG